VVTLAVDPNSSPLTIGGKVTKPIAATIRQEAGSKVAASGYVYVVFPGFNGG